MILIAYQIINKLLLLVAAISGVSAAYELIKSGLTNVTIIEAQSYLGGRINTIQENGYLLERGAQWIHGKTNNPLFNFFNPLGYIDEKTKTISDGSTLYSTPDGKIVSETLVDSITTKIDTLYDRVSEIIERQLSKDQSFASLIDAEYKKLQFVDQDLANAIYDNAMIEERINTACENLSNLSAIGWNEYVDFDGDQLINLKNGYKKIVDYLVSFVPQKQLKLNEQVTSVNWSLKQPVVATNKATYTADHVIITLPLGVLKVSSQSIFNPILPSVKINAINRIGYGTVNKFFFIFEANIFPNNEQGFQILWKKGLNVNLTSLPKCNVGSSSFYKTFNSFEVHPFYRNILYSFLYGDDAILSERLTDQCIIDVVQEMLTKIYSKIKLPKIKTLFRSKWNSNMFARGSYSHTALGSSTSDVLALAQSNSNKLFWAGEATTTEYMSTVHGAYISGLREAKKILKL